jgi:hypothetical protein
LSQLFLRVCPEPVWAKWSFSVQNGAKEAFCRTEGKVAAKAGPLLAWIMGEKGVQPALWRSERLLGALSCAAPP